MRRRKTWHEKMAKGDPKIVTIPDNWAKRLGHGKMVILTPDIINRFLQTIPEGKLATVNRIREKFAHKFHTDTTCPLTTGIFLWIAAGAAEEDRASGKSDISPYWRVLREGGKLNPKYPGGVRNQAEHLREEGFEITKGRSENSWRVKDYQHYLIAT